MKRQHIASLVILSVSLAVGIALAAQDKYTLRVPDGLAFSDFRGYENWQVVSVAQTDEVLKVIVANPTMINAYRAGVPATASFSPTVQNIRQ
jgi:hypothetical protein